MIWFKRKEIPNTTFPPVFFDNILLCFTEDNILLQHDERDLREIQKKEFEKSCVFKVVGNCLYTYNHTSISKLNLETLNLEKVWNSHFGSPAFLNETYICEQVYQRAEKRIEVGMFDSFDGKMIWKSKFNGFRFCRNFQHLLLVTDINFVHFSKINIESGRTEWEFSSNEKILDTYIFKNKLILQSNTNKLLGLDENTGVKLWELSDVSYYHTLDEDSGLLYSYAWDILRIIDPINGKIELNKQLQGSMEKYGIRPDANMHSIWGGYLYFMSNWNKPRFGGINLKTLEIEFVQDLDVEDGIKGGIPHYHNGRLYIKDSMHTLHIFERE